MRLRRKTTKAGLLWLFLSALLISQRAQATEIETVPEWASKAVFYQIFPDRFRNGDPQNDPPREYLEAPIAVGTDWKISSWTADWYARADWEKRRGTDFYRDGVFERRYGGDLRGIIDKLDYIAKLGANAIYLNPIFASHSLHKYDGDSYHHIDPYFGPDPANDFKLMAGESADPSSWKWTAADKLFLELVRECHQRGMHLIVDGVFNHTSREFFAFKDLRLRQKESGYRSWYVVDSFDDPETKRNEFSYKGWWGVQTLPVFAASEDGTDMQPGPKAYIFAATRRWMQPNGKRADGIDGWRLDVAEQRPVKFWADWNRLVRALNSEAYTTAEIWTSAAALVDRGMFSAAMNYNAFAIPVKGFLVDNRVLPTRFGAMIEKRRRELPTKVALAMQNVMDSHDTDRLASMIVNSEATVYADPNEIEFNKNNSPRSSATYAIRGPNERERSIQRLVVLFQMTYVGAPMIYYGDESGMWGAGDPDNRMPMVWQDMTYESQSHDPREKARQADEVKFDADLFSFYQRAIALRREHIALKNGAFRIVEADDAKDCFVFERSDSGETVLVALNRGSEDATLEIKTEAISAKTLFATKDVPVLAKAEKGILRLSVPALAGVALQLDQK